MEADKSDGTLICKFLKASDGTVGTTVQLPAARSFALIFLIS